MFICGSFIAVGKENNLSVRMLSVGPGVGWLNEVTVGDNEVGLELDGENSVRNHGGGIRTGLSAAFCV